MKAGMSPRVGAPDRRVVGRRTRSEALRTALRSRVRRLGFAAATAAALLVGGSSNAFACPVCFGAEETALIDGAKLGILVLLAITVAVQGAFVAFFLYLRRRAKWISEVDLDAEWSQLQKGGSRTS